MARKLAVNVTVGDTTYEAGTTPPAEVAEQITNPKAWGKVATATTTPAGKVDPGPVAEPPRNGKGSGREPWAEFAKSKGVEVADDDTAATLQTKLEDAGHIEKPAT